MGIASAVPSSSLTIVGINKTKALTLIEQSVIAPALKIKKSTSTGVELLNNNIKVSAANKMAFQVTANRTNAITIPNTGFANNPDDIIIVTHKVVAVNVNTAVYVQWNGANWIIYTENARAIPNTGMFNVVVIKQ